MFCDVSVVKPRSSGDLTRRRNVRLGLAVTRIFCHTYGELVGIWTEFLSALDPTPFLGLRIMPWLGLRFFPKNPWAGLGLFCAWTVSLDSEKPSRGTN